MRNRVVGWWISMAEREPSVYEVVLYAQRFTETCGALVWKVMD